MFPKYIYMKLTPQRVHARTKLSILIKVQGGFGQDKMTLLYTLATQINTNNSGKVTINIQLD